MNAGQAQTAQPQDVSAAEHPPPLPEGAYSVELLTSRKQLVVGPAESLLDVVLAAGVDAPFSCREGLCGVCETKVVSGQVDHLDLVLTDRERASNRTMMICVSYCKDGKLVLDL